MGWACVAVTTRTVAPAASAAAMPEGASSHTRQSPGATPSLRAASRKQSGAGLPRVTSSAVTSTGGTGMPARSRRASAKARGAEVTTAQRRGGRVRRKAAAPASSSTPSRSSSSARVRTAASRSMSPCGSSTCARHLSPAGSRPGGLSRRREALRFRSSLGKGAPNAGKSNRMGSGSEEDAGLIPHKDKLTICFAHVAYQLQAQYERRRTGIASFQAWDREALEQRIGTADVLVISGLWRNELLERARRLRFIQSIGAGTDQFPRDSLARADG